MSECLCVCDFSVCVCFHGSPKGRGSHGVRAQHPVQGDVPGGGQNAGAGAPQAGKADGQIRPKGLAEEAGYRGVDRRAAAPAV